MAGQLPESSAFAAGRRGGGEQRSWTLETRLLAGLFNVLAAANYQRAGGKGRKPTFVEPPKPKRTGKASRMSAYIDRGLAQQQEANSMN